MVEFISMSSVSSLCVGDGRTWCPWVSFVHVLAIAVFIRVAGVEAMLGAAEFNLVTFLPLGIFFHAFLSAETFIFEVLETCTS